MRGGRMRRQTQWLASSSISVTLAAPSTAALSGSLNAAALALRPFTIVRSRGYVGARTDNVAVSTAEIYEVAFGLTVVTDEAVAIGVTAVPTPATQDASDWFLYERIAGRTEISSAGIAQGQIMQVKDVDSRAMRKVDLGQDLILVEETSAISSGAIAQDYFRVLIKLH